MKCSNFQTRAILTEGVFDFKDFLHADRPLPSRMLLCKNVKKCCEKMLGNVMKNDTNFIRNCHTRNYLLKLNFSRASSFYMYQEKELEKFFGGKPVDRRRQKPRQHCKKKSPAKGKKNSGFLKQCRQRADKFLTKRVTAPFFYTNVYRVHK